MAASLALLAACSGTNNNHAKAPTVPDAVAAVLHAPHGLSARSGTDPALLALLEAQPDAAAREVARRITLEQLDTAVAQADRETVFAFEHAVELLGYLGSAQADAVLADWYRGLQARRAGGAGQGEQEFGRLSYQILDSLDARYAQPVVDAILARWNDMTSTERRLTLAYVAGASRGRSDVAERLRAMVRADAPDRGLLERAVNYIEGR